MARLILDVKILCVGRNRKNLSQEELSTQPHMSRGKVSHWETGVREPPIEILIKLSVLFNCTVDELVKGGVGS